MVRGQWLCLNGTWSFGLDPGQSGLARGLHEGAKLPDRIAMPFPPESVLSGVGNTDFMLCVWYSRRFVLPAGWKGRRLLLLLGAVDYEATVRVNGRQVGFHRGGYTSMTFEITAAVVPGRNLLVVRAVDDTRRAFSPPASRPPSLPTAAAITPGPPASGRRCGSSRWAARSSCG